MIYEVIANTNLYSHTGTSTSVCQTNGPPGSNYVETHYQPPSKKTTLVTPLLDDNNVWNNLQH